MAENDSPALKTFWFGGCDFIRTSPVRQAISPETKVLNLEIEFEEVLKLHLAIGECVRKLNSYKRSTKAGKRTALNLAIHLAAERVTVNETKMVRKGGSSRARDVDAEALAGA